MERQSSERSKRGCEEPQNKRRVDHDRDGDHGSRDSDRDRLSACDRQMVCFSVILLLLLLLLLLLILVFVWTSFLVLRHVGPDAHPVTQAAVSKH